MGDSFNIKEEHRHDLRPLIPAFCSFNRSNIALVYFVCFHWTKKACHKIIDFLVASSSKNIKAITKSKICTTKTTTIYEIKQQPKTNTTAFTWSVWISKLQWSCTLIWGKSRCSRSFIKLYCARIRVKIVPLCPLLDVKRDGILGRFSAWPRRSRACA